MTLYRMQFTSIEPNDEATCHVRRLFRTCRQALDRFCDAFGLSKAMKHGSYVRV